MCLPVCGRIASATVILRTVIILKNDASMPSCRVIKASSEIVQLRYQQCRCRWFYIIIMWFAIKPPIITWWMCNSNSKHRIRFTSQLSWTVDSHTRAHTGTNTHINRRRLSSDPLFADQMTATLRVGRGGGGKEHGGSAFSTTICYYSCHSSHTLVFEANHS